MIKLRCICAPRSWSNIKNTVVLTILTSWHLQCLHLMYAEVACVLVSSGTQVQPQIILDQDYFTDYLSVPYDYSFNEYLAQIFSFSRHSSLRLIWTLNWHFNFFFCAEECWHYDIYNMLTSFSFSCLFHSFDFRTILFNECLRFCLYSFVLWSEKCEQETEKG